MTRPADVVHDFFLPPLLDRAANASADVGQGFGSGHPRPPSLPAPSGALPGIEDAVRIVDLVDGGLPLGAVAPAAAGMRGVPLELPNRERLPIHPALEP